MTYIYVIKTKRNVTGKNNIIRLRLTTGVMLYKVLGHPARLQILRCLTETKVCITGDISEELPLVRTTVNKHLTELKKAGLIQGHVSEKNTNYCLNPEKINELKRLSESFLNEINIESYTCE